jgi:acyl carrier protein
MSTIQEVIQILDSSLQLGDRASSLKAESGLLGSLPEFDSMAVVTVMTSIEEHFGIVIDDDEISAETFESVGSLATFVDRKLSA